MSNNGATVEQVVGYLPNDADKLYDWGDKKIQEVLDEFDGSLAKTMQRFWYERWSNTHEFINVKEAGTERQLAQINSNARSMLAYWDRKVAEEEGPVPISFGEIEGPAGDC